MLARNAASLQEASTSVSRAVAARLKPQRLKFAASGNGRRPLHEQQRAAVDTALSCSGRGSRALVSPDPDAGPHAGIVWNEAAVYKSLAGPPNKWKREKVRAQSATGRITLTCIGQQRHACTPARHPAHTRRQHADVVEHYPQARRRQGGGLRLGPRQHHALQVRQGPHRQTRQVRGRREAQARPVRGRQALDPLLLSAPRRFGQRGARGGSGHDAEHQRR